MKTRPSISTWILVFTFVHLTASIASAVAPFVPGLASALDGWVVRVLGWWMTALALPILLPLHTETMSRGATALLIVANSAAAGLIFGLVVHAIRGRANDAAPARDGAQRGSP